MNLSAKKNPTVVYVPNRRLVFERGVATTTGISASMPMALTLTEAIAVVVGPMRLPTIWA